LIHEDDTYLGCQVDHVISEKHGGETTAMILGFNEAERVLERKVIQSMGKYPPVEATESLCRSDA
jgi:hypothetical protein